MKSTCVALSAVAALAMVSVSTPASAGLVNNGSFETGDITGWTLTHGTGSGNTAARAASLDFVWPSLGVAPYNAEQGNYFALLGDNIGNGASISQTINVANGVLLTLIYFVSGDGVTGADSLSASWNGNVIAGSVLTNDFSTSWTEYKFQVRGVGSHDTLLFQVEDTGGFMFLDNVQATIPEPASFALLGTGLLAAGAFGFRRRARKA